MNIIVSPIVTQTVPEALLSFVFKIAKLYKKKFKAEKCKHIFEFSTVYCKGVPYQKMIHRVGNGYTKEYSFGRKLSENPYEGCILLYDNGTDSVLVTMGSKEVAV